jgi:hypothetical protein
MLPVAGCPRANYWCAGRACHPPEHGPGKSNSARCRQRGLRREGTAGLLKDVWGGCACKTPQQSSGFWSTLYNIQIVPIRDFRGLSKALKLREWTIITMLQRGHFYILVFMLLHFVLGIVTGYSIHEYVIFSLKVMVYITGLVLFLQSLKPLKTMAIYYGFYALSLIIAGLAALFGGMFFAILSSLVLFPIVPKQAVFETDELKIYSRFQGFMAPCCSYEVVKPEWVLFEKHLGYIHVEQPVNRSSDYFKLNGNKVIYTYKKEVDGFLKPARDTTELLLMK